MDDGDKQQLERVMNLLKPNANDPTYLVLKAHLLAEEVLYSFIERKSLHARCLNDVRLGFNQLIALCRAFHPLGEADWWGWVALKKLNSLRNLLAHNLEPEGIQDRIVDFSLFLAESIGVFDESEIAVEYGNLAKKGAHPLLLGIVALHGYLIARLGFSSDKSWAALRQPDNKTVQ